MKRLFCVKKPNGKMYIPDDSFKHLYTSGVMSAEGFFEGKIHAKFMRDELNKAHKDGGFCVTRGPDHMGKHGHTNVPRMRRQPK